MRNFLYVLTLWLLVIANCVAQERTAGMLADGCRAYILIESGTDPNPGASRQQEIVTALSAGYCSGFLAGFVSGNLYADSGPDNDRKICVPSGVTVGQIARLLIRRLEEKPEFEHVQQLGFVAGILQVTWPCTPTR